MPFLRFRFTLTPSAPPSPPSAFSCSSRLRGLLVDAPATPSTLGLRAAAAAFAPGKYLFFVFFCNLERKSVLTTTVRVWGVWEGSERERERGREQAGGARSRRDAAMSGALLFASIATSKRPLDRCFQSLLSLSATLLLFPLFDSHPSRLALTKKRDPHALQRTGFSGGPRRQQTLVET